MPEVIVDIVNAIAEAKGPEFAEGLVAGINLATKERKEEEEGEE